jgi:hypothetical protein
VGCESLALEQRDEVIGGVINVWEQSLWCSARCIFATDVGAYSGALGARDGGVVVRVLREIGVSDFEFGLNLAEEKTDGLESVVLRAINLAEVHHEGAVGATGRGVLVPCTSVVEAKANGSAGIVIAETIGFLELFGELGRYIPP